MTLTTESTTGSLQPATRHALRRPVIVAATTGALVVVAAVFTAWFGHVVVAPTFGDSPPVDVGVGAVAAVTLLSTLAGWGLLAVVERWTARPRTIWTGSAVAVTIVSFAPLLGGGATVGERAALAALHILVAVIYIPLMSRTTIDQPRGRR